MRDPRVVCLICVCCLSFVLSGCGGSGGSDPSFAIVTPTGNPQAAQYTLYQARPGVSAWVEFGTDTTYGRQTSTVVNTATSNQTLAIIVAGMLAQTTYHMRAHASSPNGDWVDTDHTFTTGAPPTSPAPPQISVTTPTSKVAGAAAPTPAPGIELLSLVSTQSNTNLLESVATDLQGNIIWYCPSSAVPVKQMANGHYIALREKDLVEFDLACNTVRDVTLSQVNQSLQASGHSYNLVNFSHDVLTLANGHWVTIIQLTQNYTDLAGYPGTTAVLGDLVVDIDPNGNVVWSWSAFDHLDINRYPYFGMPDWTHCNALVYTPDHNLLLSSRAQSWVLKLDYSDGAGNGNIIWKLGPDGDFTILGGDMSQWFYSQHYPNILGTSGTQTTLAVFDNGNYRLDPATNLACGSPGAAACFTRATIFQIDESTFLANLLWEDTPGFFSFWGGSINTFSNGDVEFDASEPFDSAASQINEVTQTATPQLVWQMNITGTNAYRGLRTPSLYPGVTWQK